MKKEIAIRYGSEGAKFSKRTRAVAGALAVGVALAGLVKHEHDQDKRAAAQEKIIAEQYNRLDLQADRTKRLAKIIGVLTDTPPDIIERVSTNPQKLPGYGKGAVSEPEKQLFQASVVKLVSRDKAGGPWENSCNGMKIVAAGKPYVVTASSCIVPARNVHSAADPARALAANVVNTSPKQYGVDMSAPNKPGGIVPVVGISMSLKESRTALLEVDTQGADGRAYQAMPAISFEDRLEERLPTPGEAVFSYSFLPANNNQPVGGSGIFLGSAKNPDLPDAWDIVGLTSPTQPADDPCGYRASGSPALFAGGHVAGPLSSSSHGSYYNGSGVERRVEGNPPSIDSLREVEDYVGVDALGFSTICLYNVVTNSLMGQLLEGFKWDYDLVFK